MRLNTATSANRKKGSRGTGFFSQRSNANAGAAFNRRKKRQIAGAIISFWGFVSFALISLCAISQILIFINSVSILLGFFLILFMLENGGDLLTPYNVFVFVWLIMIPGASFSYPLMPQATALANTLWYAGVMVIGLAMCATNFFSIKKKTSTYIDASFQKASSVQQWALVAVSALAILLIGINFLKNGLVVLEGRGDKTVSLFPGYSFLTSLPLLSIPLLIIEETRIKKRWILLLAALFVVLQLLTGARWNAFLLVIMIVFSSPIKRGGFLGLLVVIVGLVLAYFIVQLIRVPITRFNQYYRDLYSNYETYLLSDLARYIGYSERLTEVYVTQVGPASYFGRYTFFPLLKFFVSIDLHESIFIYGYNATNWISYLWMDFGYTWPVWLFLLSVLVFWMYEKAQLNQRNYFWRYVWCCWGTIWLFNFYGYLHSFVYLVFLFPLLCLALGLAKPKDKKRIISK